MIFIYAGGLYFYGMDCIVTAGPTFEPLDEVRRMTNFSTGRLGTLLAGHLRECGHKVTLFIGQSATHGGPRNASKVEDFTTTNDLRTRLRNLRSPRKMAVFHAAAVSDFGFGRIYREEENGRRKAVRKTAKISTRAGQYLVELLPTPKIIAELRQWYPNGVLVGWKYEAQGNRETALRAARHQMKECGTDACVANGPSYGPGFGLVTQSGHRHLGSMPGLFQSLEKLLL